MTPKEKLLKSPRLAEIASLLNSPLLEELLEAAMLTMLDNTSRANETFAAIGAHYELEGAQRFRRTLLNLAKPVQERKIDQSGQLRHDV